MKEQLIINSRLTFFCIIFFCLFIGCKKDSRNSVSGEKGTLVFNVGGIVSVQDDFANQASVNNKSSSASVGLSANYQKLGHVDLGVETVVENMATSFAANAGLGVNDFKLLNKSAVNVNMGNGVKFVVILYNKTTHHTEFVGQATVGQDLVIDAVRGQEYDWVAYSYNTTDNINNLPSSIDDVIDTPTDKELLYAKGATSISTTVLNKPIPIVFQHKLAQIVFELDFDRLFGSINSDFVLNFKEGTNPLTKGKISLKTGNIDDIVSYSRPIVLEQDPNDENIKLIRFYVADINKRPSFTLDVSNLKVTYLNNIEDVLVAPDVIRNAVFTWTSNVSLGKRYIARLKLWYIFPERTILHVTRTGAEAYGYAAQPYSVDGVNLSPAYNKAAYNLISEPKNYGNLTESVVRSGGFRSIRCYVDGTLNTFLANKPDIVIISVYYLMDADDRTALIAYLNAGGVVLLMTDGINVYDREAQQPFFRDLFNNQSITLQNNGYNGGALYKFSNIDDEILNGPFGDIRNKYWGEDASPTTSLSNVPSSEITEYSEAKAANGTVAANGITMFKHKSRHFFWIGDGGFLSNSYTRGVYASYNIEPFATVSTTSPPANSTNPVARYNYDNYPIPKKYGYTGNGITALTTDVYNSTVFANIMSWAVINAEFFGINTGGLGRLFPAVKDWELKKDSVNVNF